MSKRALIVEDEPLTVIEEQNALKLLGYEVSAIALSGESAIEEVERDQPDVILMDIKLAGEMDGTEAALQIREKFDIPIIFITAFGDKGQSDPEKLDIPEGYGYIVKPFTHEELANALEMVLGRSD